MKCTDVWYTEVPDELRVSEDGNVEIWWNRSVETIQKMEHNHPNFTLVDHAAQEWMFCRFLCALG